MNRKLVIPLFTGAIVLASFLACKKDTDVTTTSGTTGAITALDCSSASFSAEPTMAVSFSGTATVPYSGGNGETYSAGSAIASTGVTGLTATLNAGTLTSSTGNLSYTISGTAASAGTASFAINFGGQSCSMSVTVNSTITATECTSETGVAKIVCLANNFLSTLTSSQQSEVVVSYTLTNAKRWSNLPCGLSCRNGILFSSLTAAQQAAALSLIEAATGSSSGDGYDEFSQIRAADNYLNTNGGGSSYSSGNYVIAFLGTPSTSSKWMLQFGGHHYAQNITYDNSAVTSITPMHEAVEPKGSFTYNGTTYSGPIESEHTAMQEMLGSFTSTELSSAKISGTFSDCLMVPGSTSNSFPSTKQGIQVSGLSSSAQSLVLAAIEEWVNDVDSATAAAYMAIYQSELSDTYVAFASNSSASAGSASSFLTSNTDYVRIDGPSVWIEFACQNGVVMSGIHYHTVMRDHNRDYIGL